MNIYTPQGIAELEQQLEGIVLHSMNTSVEDKDLPESHVQKTEYFNAPTTIEQAIERIMEVEMRLEDLARAAEIAGITRQYNILEGFVNSATACLESKITINQPSAEDLKLTIVTDEENA
jgi:hypothetical protein